MTSRFYLAALAGVLLCSSNEAAPPPSRPDERPRFELRAGEKFFRVNDHPTFVLGRNPVGMSPKAYDDHFRHAAAAGEQFMRVHFTFSPPGEKAGDIDAAVLKSYRGDVLGSTRRNKCSTGYRGLTVQDCHAGPLFSDGILHFLKQPESGRQ